VAWLRQALVDILTHSVDQLIALVAGTHSLVVFHLAIALSATCKVAGFNTAIGFRIAGTISGTIHIINALHFEATHSGVVGVTQKSSWTGA